MANSTTALADIQLRWDYYSLALTQISKDLVLKDKSVLKNSMSIDEYTKLTGILGNRPKKDSDINYNTLSENLAKVGAGVTLMQNKLVASIGAHKASEYLTEIYGSTLGHKAKELFGDPAGGAAEPAPAPDAPAVPNKNLEEAGTWVKDKFGDMLSLFKSNPAMGIMGAGCVAGLAACAVEVFKKGPVDKLIAIAEMGLLMFALNYILKEFGGKEVAANTDKSGHDKNGNNANHTAAMSPPNLPPAQAQIQAYKDTHWQKS